MCVSGGGGVKPKLGVRKSSSSGGGGIIVTESGSAPIFTPLIPLSNTDVSSLQQPRPLEGNLF